MILVRVHEPDNVTTHRVEMFPALIGRSMHCAVRIDDPTVSAHHAELHMTESGYNLRDLASTNGLRSHGNKLSSLDLTAYEVVYLGDVRIDVITQEALEKTHANRLIPHWAGGRGSPIKVSVALLFAYAGALLFPTIDQYREHWPAEHPTELLSKALALWAGATLGALLMSLFCKLSVKRFHFHQVLTLSVLALVATKIFTILSPTLIFNLHNVAIAPLLRHLGYGMIAFSFIYGLQRYAFRRVHKRQRVMIAAAASILTAMVTQIVLIRRTSGGDREHMSPLGLDLKTGIGLEANGDDLFFDLALSITDIDRERIAILATLKDEQKTD